MASPIRDVDRSRVNQSVINASDPAKSGFNLSYKSFNHFMLGKLHVSGFQWTMPGDKIQGSNDTFAYFERLTVPMLSEVNVSQHSFFLPLRAMDRTFEDAMSPSKLNNLSAAWSAAHWNLLSSVKQFLKVVRDPNFAVPAGLQANLDSNAVAAFNLLRTRLQDTVYLSSVMSAQLQGFFIGEFINDFVQWTKVQWPSAPTTSTKLGQVISTVLRCLIPLFGSGSLIDSLGYNYIRLSDIQSIFDSTASHVGDNPTFSSWLDQLLDDTYMNEFLIRMYYISWYEKYRVNSVEPKGGNLPNWRDFGATSIVNDPNNSFGWIYLILRSRSWMEDMFTTAQIDDPCRHVYAPIFTDDSANISFPDQTSDYLNASRITDFNFDQHNISGQRISYLNSNGSPSSIYCPLPSRVNDFLSHVSPGFTDTYALDLLNLRQAQALEKYLKRLFYFGDEYQDYVLAQYGSKVNDLRINKPELVGASINGASYKQEVANVTTDGSNTGDRVATGTIEGHGDGYSFFSEEFGILMHFVSFMPTPQYAGVISQNMIEKQIDFPLPVFAQNNEEFGRIMEIASSGLAKSDVLKRTFGHYPYAHAWRGRVDEVHGHFLDDKQNYTFRRYFGMDSNDSYPKLNSAFMHCVPNLGMFADTVRFNGQLYGWTNHNCYVERVLPVPVENI